MVCRTLRKTVITVSAHLCHAVNVPTVSVIQGCPKQGFEVGTDRFKTAAEPTAALNSADPEGQQLHTTLPRIDLKYIWPAITVFPSSLSPSTCCQSPLSGHGNWPIKRSEV